MSVGSAGMGRVNTGVGADTCNPVDLLWMMNVGLLVSVVIDSL